MSDWGDMDGDGIIDVVEITTFLQTPAFKKMTKFDATQTVKDKVFALAMAYDKDKDFALDSGELQAIKDSGYCDCLCNEIEKSK